MTAAITFSDLDVRYGASVVLQRLNLSIEEGQFTCLLGPSGCGKSTMLRLAGELAAPTGGQVDVLGEAPHQAWRNLAFVFQAPRLVPWRTALGNVLLGLQLRGARGTRAELRQRARRALETVGIEHLADRPAHVLSGGEQQRVSIARALAIEPKVLLMDEPFSALDVQTRRALRQEIVSLWRRTGLTIVFVTHDIDEALIVGSRVVVFSGKPTRVLAERSVELAQPVTAATHGFTEMHDEVVALFGTDSAIVDELTDSQ